MDIDSEDEEDYYNEDGGNVEDPILDSAEEEYDSINKYKIKEDELLTTIQKIQCSSNHGFKFDKYYSQARDLLATMEYMHLITNDENRRDWDCIYGLITKDYRLIECALGVLGMNPNKVDADGNTALHAAITNVCPRSLKLLLANGADPFQCNNDGFFPMDSLRRDSRYAIQCSDMMDIFISDLVYTLKNKLTRKNGNQYVVKIACTDTENVDNMKRHVQRRNQKIKKYKKVVTGLLEIDNMKNKIFTILESGESPAIFENPKDLITLLHRIDPIVSYFKNETIPGVTQLQIEADGEVQDWYIRKELSKRNWSHDIQLYFIRGVKIMKMLHIICQQDKVGYAQDILPQLQQAQGLLNNVRRERKRSRR